MIINQATLDALRQGLTTRFQAGLQSAPPMDEARWSTPVPSTTKIENYPFAAFLDTIEQWIGPRQVGNMAAKNLAVENLDYHATLGVPANAIEDDQVGIYGTIAEGKGRQCRGLWGKIGTDALVGNGKWLDNAAFFGTTRKFAGSTISNYGTTALSATTYGTARVAMMSYTGYDGDPLGIVPDVLMVGPKLETTGKEIVELPVVATTGLTGESTYKYGVTAPNPYYKTAQLVVNPRLVGTYDDYWFLMCTTFVVKPVLIQKRKEGALVALDKPTDANVFFGTVDGKNVTPGGIYVYGAHYRGAACLALPHLVHGNYVA